MPISAYQKLVNFREGIEETSLSRVAEFIRGRAAFGMISASRGEKSPQENEANTARLAAEIRRAGYGYIKTEGGYPETDKETGEVTPKEELSFFVPGFRHEVIDSRNYLLEVLLAEGKRFEQETILYRPFTHYDRVISLYSCATGEKVDTLGKNLSFQQIGDYWTRLRTGTHAARQKFKVTTLDNPLERAKQEI